VAVAWSRWWAAQGAIESRSVDVCVKVSCANCTLGRCTDFYHSLPHVTNAYRNRLQKNS
jgi:hypothetical protein